ncbi:hypothetical protein GCM10028807_08740 [Spirosoma daeguense]
MNVSPLSFLYSLFVTLALSSEIALAQTKQENLLIRHLVREASEPDAHSENDTYLRITIGAIDYVAELKTATIVYQQKSENPSGGTCGNYVEAGLTLLDKNKQQTSQGASQVIRYNDGNKWTRIALSEGDYSCEKLKRIPKSVISCLKLECN